MSKEMTEEELLKTAEQRIQECRTAEAELSFVDAEGKPVKSSSVHLQLTSHEFKLGANAFNVGRIKDRKLQEAYNDRFAALLNYATLPFYWGAYEPEQGVTEEKRLTEMALWCRANNITAKGHPLVWHEVFPDWAGKLSDDQVLEALEARVRKIVGGFRGLINIWDVVNEATVSKNFNNAVGRWIKSNSAGNCVARSLDWAHRANTGATLLYNDFNVSEDYERLLAALKEKNAPVGTIGIQSHMHKGSWPVEKIWSVCETYSRFNLPIHFTEVTILSGNLKQDDDWHNRKSDWLTTPDGEKNQLEYGKKFYTILFSHPSVEAITWWDFSDLGAWQGAPAGLTRKDLTPKPLYEWLMDAFHKHWTTDTDVNTDETGKTKVRAFFGNYQATAIINGKKTGATFNFYRHDSRQVRIVLKS